MLFFKSKALIILFVLAGFKVFAQPGFYSDPVKIPIFLSANFCELRSNHFHGGIDIKTQQRIGVPIYSAADGFIYRIVVSPTGYGRAIYIEHPNGTSSVYGHLHRFRDDIEEFVRNEQYKRKSFAVNLTLNKEQFPIKKEDFIAQGGNSGSSGGPHLHFEIRDSKTQDALNPLAYPFSVMDKTPPRIYNLVAYPVAENSHINSSTTKRNFTATPSGQNYGLGQNSEIEAFGPIAFAIRANDFYDGSNNVCGIYSAHLKVNGKEIFAYKFDRMPFSDTRYLNSHIDYEIAANQGSRIHRMWRLPGDRLKIYHTDINRGIINIEDGKSYNVEISIYDLEGNSARLNFQVKGAAREIARQPVESTAFFTYDDENIFRTPFLEIFAPVGAFYDDFYFNYEVSEQTKDLFSKIHRIHSESEPVHQPIRLKVLAEGLPDSLVQKSFIGMIDGKGRKSFVGGKFAQNRFETEVRSFGNYAVMTDTIPPQITPLSIKDNNAITETNRIRFTITDDLAGIKSYEGTINGEWVLFDYDAKNRMLTYEFDRERLELGKRHSLVLTVSDNVNNTSTYEATFWK